MQGCQQPSLLFTSFSWVHPYHSVAACTLGCDLCFLPSTVLLQGANLSNTKVVGSQFARAQAQGAILVNTDFTDTNLYGT